MKVYALLKLPFTTKHFPRKFCLRERENIENTNFPYFEPAVHFRKQTGHHAVVVTVTAK